MNTLSKAYARLSGFLSSPSFTERPGLTFRDVCKTLRVSPVDLDRLVRDELGLSGPELLEAFSVNDHI